MRNAKEEEMKWPNNNSYLYSPEPCFFSRPFVRLWTWEWNPSFSYHIQGWEGYHWWKNDWQQAVACVFTQLLRHVWLFATPRTVAHLAPPSMGFPSQEYCSGLPSLLQRIFPTQRSNSHLLHCWEGSSPLKPPGEQLWGSFSVSGTIWAPEV